MLGFVGTGLMGFPMARRLLEAGYKVVAWNRTVEKARPLQELGAMLASDLREVAEKADVVMVMVSDDEASEAVVRELVGSKSGICVVNHSTVSPSHTLQARRLAEAAGSTYLAVPVMGGPSEAQRGELLGIAGGDKEALERLRQVLSAYLREIVYVGSPEEAAAVKLAVNSLYFSSMVGLAEAILLAEAWGVEPHKFLQVASKLWVRAIIERYGERLLSEAKPLRFKMRLAAKDMFYALKAGYDRGQPLPHIAALAQLFLEAATLGGMGEEDYTNVIRFLKSRAASTAQRSQTT
uniref:NAD(P)-dependent oxidoreductase n=1 Tax=Thermofilum pendens TaxID=2269 RepID=A0A7C4B8U2_THEPE